MLSRPLRRAAASPGLGRWTDPARRRSPLTAFATSGVRVELGSRSSARGGNRRKPPAHGGDRKAPRPFGPIGHIPPAEAEANYYAAIDNLDMVA